MTTVQGVKQFTDLIAIPDIASLELRQCDMSNVDMVEYRRNLHLG